MLAGRVPDFLHVSDISNADTEFRKDLLEPIDSSNNYTSFSY